MMLIDSLRNAVERASALTFDELPERTQITAQHSLIDWLGCAVAGSVGTASTQVRGALASEKGFSPVIARVDRVGWRDAILINGVQGHELDFDDMLPAIQGHPAAAVFPALFVLGEKRGSSVAEIIASYVAGIEIGSWVASQLMPEHYDAGWHGTATVGTFASAAAVAHLLGLTQEQWISTLDFAATQASGIRELFGTTGKPLHAGRAAESGAIAAMLAEEGAQSQGQGLVGERGFLKLYSADKLPRLPASDNWAVDGTLYKTYASCFMTQSVIDSGISLSKKISPADITHINIQVSPKLRDVCAIENPATANEAKFSLHATTALAILGKDLSDEHNLASEQFVIPEYQKLRELITLEFQPELSGCETRSIVTVSLGNGEKLSIDCDRGVPEADLKVREQGLTRKAIGLASPIIGTSHAELMAEKVLASQTAVVELAEILQPK